MRARTAVVAAVFASVLMVVGPAAGERKGWRPVPETTADPAGLLEPHVLCLAEGHDGAIWIGTVSGGLTRFDPADGSWRTYADARVRAARAVVGIHVARDGVVWLAHDDEIAHIDPETGRWVPAGLPKWGGRAHVAADHIGEDHRGGLWFVQHLDGVAVRDPDSGEWSRPREGDGGVPYFGSGAAEDDAGMVWLVGTSGAVRTPAGEAEFELVVDAEVQRVHVGSSGWVWLAGLGMRVDRVWPGTSSVDTVRLPSADNIGPWDVKVVHEDRTGDLWVGTRGEGLWRYDPAAHSWEESSLPRAEHGISAILEDQHGQLWVGTRGEGLFRGDPGTGIWHRWGGEVGRGCPRVEALLEASDGRIWVATAGGGVSVFDPFASEWETLPLHPEPGIPGAYLRHTKVDNQGDLWFVGAESGVGALDTDWYGGGLVRYDRATGDWSSIPLPFEGDVASLGSFHRTTGGDLWLGRMDGWLHRDAGADSWTPIPAPGQRLDLDRQGFVETADGQLWAHGPHSLVRLDGATDGRPARTFLLDDLGPSPWIWSLHREPDGAMVARSREGFLRCDEVDGPCRLFEVERPPRSAAAVTYREHDDHGRLWLGTRDGTFHLRDGESWFRFPRPPLLRGGLDGRPWVDDDGHVWIGYGAAAARFAPDGTEYRLFSAIDGPGLAATHTFRSGEDGALWALAHEGVSRLRVGDEPGRPLSLDGRPDPRELVALGGDGDLLCEARPAGLVLTGTGGVVSAALGPAGEWATALAGSPEGCWAGVLVSGLLHLDQRGRAALFTPEHGLPDGRILDISRLPGTDSPCAWVGTDRGAARVCHHIGVDRVIGPARGGSPGAVDHVLALPDWGAVLAYNPFPDRYTADSASEGKRASSHLRVVPRIGNAGPPISLPDGQVTDMAVDADGRIWIATDAGLHRLVGTELVPFPIPGVPPSTPVLHLATHPNDPDATLYIALDPARDDDAQVIRHRPNREYPLTTPWKHLDRVDVPPSSAPIDSLSAAVDGGVLLRSDGATVHWAPRSRTDP